MTSDIEMSYPRYISTLVVPILYYLWVDTVNLEIGGTFLQASLHLFLSQTKRRTGNRRPRSRPTANARRPSASSRMANKSRSTTAGESTAAFFGLFKVTATDVSSVLARTSKLSPRSSTTELQLINFLLDFRGF